MPSITLTRQQLYDRAWTIPLDTLAKELGLSGRGLGKLCDRHDIPVPPRGWWAKTAAGHRVKRSPCRPRIGTRTTFKFEGPERQELASEITPDTHPRVPERLRAGSSARRRSFH